MRVLCLFNKVVGETMERICREGGPTNQFFGLFELRQRGVAVDVIELETYLPPRIARFLRKHVLTMHYAHLPLFRLFFRYNIVFTSTAFGALIVKALFRIRSFKWVILDFNLLGTIADERSFRQKLLAWAIGRSDGIVTISEAERDGLHKRFPHLRDKIIFLHEPTSLTAFTPADSKQDIDVISVGNYGRDLATLVEAVRDSEIQVLIAGKPSLVEKLLPLPANVRSQMFPAEKMREMYARAKLAAVLVTTNERYFDSVGTLSVGEAFAAGKPTIVTHTKNMESYVEDGENALFVPPKDPVLLRGAIKRLLGEKALRERFAGNARTWAETHLDPNVFAEKLAAFFEEKILER